MKVKDDATVHGITPSGSTFTVKLKQDKLRDLTINVLNKYASSGAVSLQVETEVLGSLLYESLFQADANENLKISLDQAIEDKRTLRIVLEFAREPKELVHLRDLPWEFLYVPRFKWGDRGFFIASQANLVLTREVAPLPPVDGDAPATKRTPTNAPSGGERKEVQVLVVRSSPRNLDNADPDEEVLGHIKKWKAVVPTVKIETLYQPDKDSLQATIRAQHWDIVHFIGHGEYQHNSDYLASGGRIALVAKNGRAAWVADATFADCFRGYFPELVFLQACEGAETGSHAFLGFRGIAMTLVSDGVPAVIAMQYSIENGTANAFAGTFYEKLSEGCLVSEAVQAGREGLAKSPGQDNFVGRDFGSPVLYLQNADMCFGKRKIDAPGSFPCPKCDNQEPNTLSAKDGYCRKCESHLRMCEACAKRFAVVPDRCCESCRTNEADKALSPEAVPARPASGEGPSLDPNVRLATASGSPPIERGAKRVQGPVGVRIGRT